MSKEYLIDDKEVTFQEVIKAAAEIDDDFAESPIKQTSIAAGILRRAGHNVRDNPNHKRN